MGKALVCERLQQLGCVIRPSANPGDGRLEITTVSGRELEVFVSTQRVGGYVFWTKRRLQPSAERFAALVLLDAGSAPELYLVPTTDWLDASHPLTDRDYEGLASEPEWGIAIGPASLGALRRYAWTDSVARRAFR